MKAFLKFSGLIAAVLAIVSIILMMATPALSATSGNVTVTVDGTTVLFGADTKTLLGTVHTNGAWSTLVGWILTLVAAIALLVVGILPLLKVNALDKFAGLIALCSACALIVGGVLLFFVQPAMNAANAVDAIKEPFKNYSLGAGHIVAAILNILAGLVAACPAVMKLLKK